MPGSSGAMGGRGTPAAFFHRKTEDGALVGTEKVWGHHRGRCPVGEKWEGQCPFPELSRVVPPLCPRPPGGHCARQPPRPARASARSLSQTQRQACQDACPLAAHPLALRTSPPCPSPLVVPVMVGRLTQIKTIFFFFQICLAYLKMIKPQ